MKIKERILSIATHSGQNRTDFFNTLGITYGNFTGKNKNTPVNSNLLIKLVTEYGIDAHWLLTGEGDPKGVKDLSKKADQSKFIATFEKLLLELNSQLQELQSKLEVQQKQLTVFKSQLSKK